eukprot:8050344-Pyramimonas_sp.AAC.1
MQVKGKYLIGSDASGGPHNKDPRKRRVGWGVDTDYAPVGTLRGSLAGKQTVNRGELYAATQALLHVQGESPWYWILAMVTGEL